MKMRLLITSIAALLLVVASVNSADAHRWGRRGVCRPARVVVVPRFHRPHVVIAPHLVVRHHGWGGRCGRPMRRHYRY